MGKRKPGRPLTVRPIEPCICEHAKRDHEGETGVCEITGCKCMEYIEPDGVESDGMPNPADEE